MHRIVKGASILTSLALLIALLPAQAQYGQQKTFGGTKKFDGKNIKKQDAEHSASSLDRPVTLPSLPSFTGTQHFIMGLSYPNAKNGPGWIQTFNVQNTEEQVMQWWTSALRQHQWKVTYTDKKTVRAKLKDGSTCTVTVDPPTNSTKEKMKGCHASYSVYYHKFEKPRR